ncbi:rhodanese-like domain-containing protein [Rathayibacter tanaceti]|uniref:Rhodanese-like domain-containing protein n=1 Tax=Rathayibacter tanaceti TaxID=1671680 RepID=A0AAE6V7H1_9MICO|nr:rhodanese-like domain-containing protein [Rathayibacter tanaceti]
MGLVERDEVWLLDVREPHEWALGHAPGAHHIPMGQIGARQGELPSDVPILAVCHSGVRSAMVVQALHGAGYETANVQAGMTAWAAAGGAVVDDEGRPGRVD